MRKFNQPGRSPVHALNAMASTSQTLSTQVAIDVLKAGGNALDAGIAACAVQCVIEPGSTGIGGDCFAMYAPNGSDKPIAFNGSGKAPAAATVQALKERGVTQLERSSPHSVVVPGAIDAWTQLHKDHGRMPFSELLQPAIDTARQGYAIAARAQYDIQKQTDFLLGFEHAARHYLDNNQAPAVGSVRKQAAMADALEAIAAEGSDAFYRGHLATEMVEELQAHGGLHTLEDFANVKGDYVEPISTQFRGHTIHECPPNGQGVIALLMLNMMSEIAIDKTGPMSLQRIHTEIEACRLAYEARRNYVADPAQAQIPVDALLSASYAQAMCERIDSSKATPLPRIPEAAAHNDTVYITVVDKDRNACSFINTLYWCFGSGITTKSGITLTNRGMGFTLDENSSNCIAPNKRPLHTIIPALATKDGKVSMCFGVMGGEYQAMGHQQFLTRYFDYGCDIQEAMDLPRFMVNPFSGEVEMEAGIDDSVRQKLQQLGHSFAEGEFLIGGSQAIAIDWQSGVLTGGSDPRKDGCAMGY